MNCSGRDLAGEPVLVEFDAGILTHVDPLLDAAHAEDVSIAPGFIDLQVNGFAGVDYNEPSATHEATARSLHLMFSTLVTRVFPTLITVHPQRMTISLSNLSSARHS